MAAFPRHHSVPYVPTVTVVRSRDSGVTETDEPDIGNGVVRLEHTTRSREYDQVRELGLTWRLTGSGVRPVSTTPAPVNLGGGGVPTVGSSAKHASQCICVECIGQMERELNADLDEWMGVDMCLHALHNAEVDVMHQTTMDLNENVLTSRVSGARSLRKVRDSVTDTRRERLFETDGNEQLRPPQVWVWH